VKLCLYIPPERKEYKTKFNLTTDEWESIKTPLLKDKELRTIKNDISEIENKARKALDSLIKPTFESFIEALEKTPSLTSLRRNSMTISFN
jgi:hypothetical protein